MTRKSICKSKRKTNLGAVEVYSCPSAEFIDSSPTNLNSVSNISTHSYCSSSQTSASKQENSLGGITKKFVNLFYTSSNGIVDLSKAAGIMNVKKRRIYDITNVLEGLGLIVKISKNNVKWVSDAGRAGEASEGDEANAEERLELESLCKDLQSEIEILEVEDKILDKYTEYADNILKKLGEDDEIKRMAYVTHSDIRGIGMLRDETLLAINAPMDTTIEIPIEQNNGYDQLDECRKLYIENEKEDINVYFVREAAYVPEQARNVSLHYKYNTGFDDAQNDVFAASYDYNYLDMSNIEAKGLKLI